MKYYALCVLGAGLIIFSVVQGFIQRRIMVPMGGGRVTAFSRKTAMTGSDAVLLGSLGTAAGLAVVIVGVLGIRTEKKQPPEW